MWEVSCWNMSIELSVSIPLEWCANLDISSLSSRKPESMPCATVIICLFHEGHGSDREYHKRRLPSSYWFIWETLFECHCQPTPSEWSLWKSADFVSFRCERTSRAPNMKHCLSRSKVWVTVGSGRHFVVLQVLQKEPMFLVDVEHESESVKKELPPTVVIWFEFQNELIFLDSFEYFERELRSFLPDYEFVEYGCVSVAHFIKMFTLVVFRNYVDFFNFEFLFFWGF